MDRTSMKTFGIALVIGVVAMLLVEGASSWTAFAQGALPVVRSGPIKGKALLPDGKPAANARVTLISQLKNPPTIVAEVRTDASGAFTFENPPWPALGQPELKLIVEADGFGLAYKGLADWKNGDALHLAKAAELHASFFQPGGKPATGVTVRAKLLVGPLVEGEHFNFLTLPTAVAERYTAKVDGGGSVVIKGLPQGWKVRLGHDSPHFAKLDMEQQFVLANAAVTESQPIHFQPGASLAGKVTIGATGEPQAGVRVNAQEADRKNGGGGRGWGMTLTDKDGRFVISQLSPGNYNLNAMLAGNMEADWTSVAFDSTPLKLGEDRTGLDIKLVKGGLIVGRVTGPDGKAVEGMHVGAYGPARPRSGAWVQNTVTDKYGRYVFRVPPGSNHVYLMGGPANYDPTDDLGQDIEVLDGKEIVVDFKIPR